MQNSYKTSPFKPTEYDASLGIDGVKAGAIQANLHYQGRTDYTLLTFEEGAEAAAIFTNSTLRAAPVLLSRDHLDRSNGKIRAMLINAGNANAFTGEQGAEVAKACAQTLSSHLGVNEAEVLLASTGVIGVIPNRDKMLACLPPLIDTLKPQPDWLSLANSIMTTDTYAKYCAETCKIDGKTVQLIGFAKGSGMIAPDMATMLGFIVTDAQLSADVLNQLLRHGAMPSFNAISVDSDCSTNDSVFLITTKKADHALIADYNDPRLKGFKQALNRLMHRMAMQIIRDGEGVRKLIEARVTGAKSAQSANRVARAIIDSPLVKTAIAGEDPNWGRVIMAIGKSREAINLHQLSVKMGGIMVAFKGAPNPTYNREDVIRHLKGEEILIEVDLGNDKGRGKATLWGCDLTHDYVSINADYSS